MGARETNLLGIGRKREECEEGEGSAHACVDSVELLGCARQQKSSCPPFPVCDKLFFRRAGKRAGVCCWGCRGGVGLPVSLPGVHLMSALPGCDTDDDDITGTNVLSGDFSFEEDDDDDVEPANKRLSPSSGAAGRWIASLPELGTRAKDRDPKPSAAASGPSQTVPKSRPKLPVDALQTTLGLRSPPARTARSPAASSAMGGWLGKAARAARRSRALEKERKEREKKIAAETAKGRAAQDAESRSVVSTTTATQARTTAKRGRGDQDKAVSVDTNPPVASQRPADEVKSGPSSQNTTTARDRVTPSTSTSGRTTRQVESKVAAGPSPQQPSAQRGLGTSKRVLERGTSDQPRPVQPRKSPEKKTAKSSTPKTRPKSPALNLARTILANASLRERADKAMAEAAASAEAAMVRVPTGLTAHMRSPNDPSPNDIADYLLRDVCEDTTELDISGQRVGDAVVSAMAARMSGARVARLSRLRLDDNGITGASLRALSGAVSRLPSLTELSLARNGLGRGGPPQALGGFFRAVAHSRCVRNLDMGRTAIGPGAGGLASGDLGYLVRHGSLRTLRLEGNALGLRALWEVADGARENYGIVEVTVDPRWSSTRALKDLQESLERNRGQAAAEGDADRFQQVSAALVAAERRARGLEDEREEIARAKAESEAGAERARSEAEANAQKVVALEAELRRLRVVLRETKQAHWSELKSREEKEQRVSSRHVNEQGALLRLLTATRDELQKSREECASLRSKLIDQERSSARKARALEARAEAGEIAAARGALGSNDAVDRLNARLAAVRKMREDHDARRAAEAAGLANVGPATAAEAKVPTKTNPQSISSHSVASADVTGSDEPAQQRADQGDAKGVSSAGSGAIDDSAAKVGAVADTVDAGPENAGQGEVVDEYDDGYDDLY